MPWDYKTNKPDAVKYLHPKIQRKAIKIANAILREGGDEGVAIATGIKKAKGLVKLAMNFKQFIRPMQRNKGFVGISAGLGAVSGAGLGASTAYETDVYGHMKTKDGKLVKKKNTSVLGRSLIGATVGAGLIGGYAGKLSGQSDKFRKRGREWRRSFNNDFNERTNKPGRNTSWGYQEHQGGSWKYHDSSKHNSHDDFFDDFFKQYSGGSSGSRSSSGYRPPPPAPKVPKADHASFFKEHGNIDHTTITTKKQAKSVYRQAAQKHHPDMPSGNTEKFKQLNNDWTSIQNSGWFNKLAMIIKRLKNGIN